MKNIGKNSVVVISQKTKQNFKGRTMKVCVVIRFLPNYKPVTHCVFREPEVRLDNPEGYLEEKANKLILEFKDKFPEFKEATFYINIVELDKE